MNAAFSTDRQRGIALSLGAAVGNAFFLIPFRRATELANQDLMVLALLFFAAVYNTTAESVLGDKSQSWTRWSRVELWTALLLTVLSVAGNFAGARAIALLNPAVASVMLQTQVLFAALGGFVVLRERVSRRFLVGSGLSIVGIVVMRLGDGGVRLGLEGTAWGLASGAFFGFMQVASRKYVRRIRPVAVNALRLWGSVGLLCLVPGKLSGVLQVPWPSLAFMAAAAFAGPFLGRLCLLYSTKYVSAATSTLLGLSAPLFTLVLGLAVMGAWPTTHELVGGAVVVGGMLLALKR